MFNPLKDLISLLYPNVCVGCDKNEPVHYDIFCHICWEQLPDYLDIGSNKEIIKSRFPLIHKSKFYGLFLFTKSGIIQNVLHKIKYKGRADIARKLGELLADKLPKNTYDALIPIPMHRNKRRRRGYNQAQEIAKGINLKTDIPIYNNALKKMSDTKSQTKKDRISRRLNVMKAYRANIILPPDINKILIVDDVITTGATLEACSEKLLEKRHVDIDYAFIALSV